MPETNTNSPEVTPDPQGKPATEPEMDLAELLVRDDGPVETKPEPAPAEKPAETAADPDPKEEPTPGTPDKAIQKLQQDLAATSRKLDALLEKAETQGLTKAEQQQVQQQQRKIDEVRGLLEKREWNAIDHGDALAEVVVEHEQVVSKQEERIRALEAKLQQTEQASTWEAQTKAYPGVDVQGVWQRACQDAVDLVGNDVQPQKLLEVASKLYHKRAAKAVSAAKVATTPKPSPAAPVPKGTSVQIDAGPQATAPSEDGEYLAAALGLVKD